MKLRDCELGEPGKLSIQRQRFYRHVASARLEVTPVEGTRKNNRDSGAEGAEKQLEPAYCQYAVITKRSCWNKTGRLTKIGRARVGPHRTFCSCPTSYLMYDMPVRSHIY